jgi:hypothetical protein
MLPRARSLRGHLCVCRQGVGQGVEPAPLQRAEHESGEDAKQAVQTECLRCLDAKLAPRAASCTHAPGRSYRL